MTLGEKIRTLRESSNMLQRELAYKLKVGDAYISKVETGNKDLKKGHLKTLSEIFNCPYSELETLWFAKKVYDIVKNEQQALEMLKVAEETILYNKKEHR